MKALMIGVVICSSVLTAWGELFQMDRKGDATVEVNKVVGEYRVTCRFRPQTKFDKAINAKFNDAKGDSLCKKGLARYLKVVSNETLAVSGLHSAAPVKTEGERLCYSFGVPFSGCKVLKTAVNPRPQNMSKKSVALTQKKSPATTNVAPAKKSQEIRPTASVQSNVATSVTRSSSYVCVTKYREVNGKRTTISQKEYQGRDFKSTEDFDSFCQREFARIQALGEANLRAVRNLGK